MGIPPYLKEFCDTTRVAQVLNTLESIQEDFICRVNSSISSIRIPTGSVVNMDEISIRFDAVPTVILNNRGARTVRVLSAGNASRCTDLLAVSMDGTKLPPFIIFKGRENGRIHRQLGSSIVFPTSAKYTVQEKAWINRSTLLDWIERFGTRSAKTNNALV